MSFSEESWREATGQFLREKLPVAIAAESENIYGLLATGVLWPLAVAAQNGETMAVGMALGSFAGSAGSNLLANQLQALKNENNAPQQLKQAAQNNPQLRQALDVLLEKLDLIKLGQSFLNDRDRQWFAETIWKELKALAAAPALQKQVRSITIDGDVQNSTVVTGDYARINIEKHYYLTGDPQQQQKIKALYQAYYQHLFARSQILELSGIDPRAASDAGESLKLDSVYTALMTGHAEQEQQKIMARGHKAVQKLLSALNCLNREQHLVLLGDPGSGKSTFVKFVALCMAGEALRVSTVNIGTLTRPLPEQEDREEKPVEQKWDHGLLLPVHVVLREFAARGLPARGRGSARHLVDFITESLRERSLQDFAGSLQTHLKERGGLILLDGLDEIADAERLRPMIKEVITDFRQVHGKCRLLVTSRTYAYQRQDWKLPDFTEVIIQPFNDNQINNFVELWYAHIGQLRGWAGEDIQARAAVLKTAITRSDRLRELAERPLLLTLMASLHAWRGGSLPERREELYNDAVELLVDWWERPKNMIGADGEVGQRPSIAEWLKIDRQKVRELLNLLAFEAHSSQKSLQGTADIAESRLVDGLMEINRNPDVRPRLLIDYLSNRAGLLVHHGVKVYSFPHRTFQEYLAACHLTDEDFPEKLAELACKEPNRWREVVMLAGAKAGRGSTSSVWTLADALCPEFAQALMISPEACWGAHLAARQVVENSKLENLSTGQQSKMRRLRLWLQELLRAETFPALERMGAGESLARLGDPRREVVPRKTNDLAQMQFCYVPGGPFYMGSRDKEAFDDEKPQHLNKTLQTGYWMGRYPVTNRQFQHFVEDAGYANPAWWGEAQEAGLWSSSGFMGGSYVLDDNTDVKFVSENFWRMGPFEFGEPFELSNHPVVGVSWYEALAYCRWLTVLWRGQGLLAEGEEIRLPSEAEWEKAARGGQKIAEDPLIRSAGQLGDQLPPVKLIKNPAAKRRYPWGNEAAGNERLNYNSDAGVTSAAGCFPQGKSPCGCEEQSGTVWEWTGSLWGEDLFKPQFRHPYRSADRRENLAASQTVLRVMRGGSWANDARNCRVSSRNRVGPAYRGSALGFRLLRTIRP